MRRRTVAAAVSSVRMGRRGCRPLFPSGVSSAAGAASGGALGNDDLVADLEDEFEHAEPASQIGEGGSGHAPHGGR
eukprot:13892333-Heterocapsa_arctica.AAC.1